MHVRCSSLPPNSTFLSKYAFNDDSRNAFGAVIYFLVVSRFKYAAYARNTYDIIALLSRTHTSDVYRSIFL